MTWAAMFNDLLGEHPHLKGSTALVRQDPHQRDCYLAQFDSLDAQTSRGVTLAYGWHCFAKSEFDLLELPTE